MENLENSLFKKALVEIRESSNNSKSPLFRYEMGNHFLTTNQKAIVEAWFQFPIGVFIYSLFILFILLGENNILEVFIYSYLIGIIIAIINWKFHFKIFIYLGYIVGGTISSIISVIFLIYFVFNQHYIFMFLALADIIGLLSIISPSLHLYNIFSRNKFHPKYLFASKYFKIS